MNIFNDTVATADPSEDMTLVETKADQMAAQHSPRFFSCLGFSPIRFRAKTLNRRQPMNTYSTNGFQDNSLKPLESTSDTDVLGADRPTQTRIRLRIPKEYNDEPIISRLVSHHGVTVNIAAALLGSNGRDDGWFDLELRGTSRQIQSALTYLDEMDLEIWGESNQEEDGW